MDVDLLEGDWNKITYFQMVVKMMIYHGRKESNNLKQIQVQVNKNQPYEPNGSKIVTFTNPTDP